MKLLGTLNSQPLPLFQLHQQRRWSAYSQEQWQQGWEDVYAETYTTSFEAATTGANQAVAQTIDQA